MESKDKDIMILDLSPGIGSGGKRPSLLKDDPPTFSKDRFELAEMEK
jgi:hypothetical protein